MVIYSVTVTVDPVIETQWVDYMRNTHISALVGTGCFTAARFFRVIDPVDARGWKTYCTQYEASDRGEYERYIRDFAAVMRRDVTEHFGERFNATRQVLETF